IDEPGVRLGIEIRCGNVDGEFVLQSLVEGFGDLHGVPSSSRLVRPESAATWSIWSTQGVQPAPVVRRTQSPRGKQVREQSSCKRCKRLVRAEGLEPPQLSSLEPKSACRDQGNDLSTLNHYPIL